MLKNKKILQKTASIAAALLFWQAAAVLLNEKIILVAPTDVFARLFTIWEEPAFFSSIWFSLSRIAAGFLIALVVGVVLALAAGRFHIVEIILWPYMVTVKSIPVASFIIIALVWLTSSSLSVFISFMIVLPIIYTNILNAIRSVDKKMLQMADVFKLSFMKRLVYIWLPQIKPFLFSACSIAIGLAWKSGVAAEIIGIPQGSIGEALYYSKVYLNTTDMFTWTLIIVIMSVAFEKLFALALKFFYKGIEKL